MVEKDRWWYLEKIPNTALRAMEGLLVEVMSQ